MSSFVLDSSVILAFLYSEPGGEQVIDLAPAAYVSSVNMAEVYSKLSERGLNIQQTLHLFASAIAGVLPFTDEMAKIAGFLRIKTKPYGLSLGDRACLATALTLKATAVTADKAWSEISVSCPIKLIRS